MKYLLLTLVLLFSCNNRKSINDLGSVKYLPKGEYVIQNQGSRHIVKCVKPDGKYYWLNDLYFDDNGISGYDAHQYRNPTKIIVK